MIGQKKISFFEKALSVYIFYNSIKCSFIFFFFIKFIKKKLNQLLLRFYEMTPAKIMDQRTLTFV